MPSSKYYIATRCYFEHVAIDRKAMRPVVDVAQPGMNTRTIKFRYTDFMQSIMGKEQGVLDYVFLVHKWLLQ